MDIENALSRPGVFKIGVPRTSTLDPDAIAQAPPSQLNQVGGGGEEIRMR